MIFHLLRLLMFYQFRNIVLLDIYDFDEVMEKTRTVKTVYT